jgi:hypothetical protein
MRTSSTLIFVALALLALSAHAKEDALQALKYEFSVGNGEDPQILENMESEIDNKLNPVQLEEFKGGESCVKLSRKGFKRGTISYVCSTAKDLYQFMASVYFKYLDVHSPVSDISMTVSATATSCSIGGCNFSGHRGAQPCFLVTDFLVGGIWCRHTPYTSAHNCIK